MLYLDYIGLMICNLASYRLIVLCSLVLISMKVI